MSSVGNLAVNLLRSTRVWRLIRLSSGLSSLSPASLLRANYLPRNEHATLTLLGRPLRICDGASFLHTFEEIFIRRIYDFPCDDAVPYFIDAGANIGLATLFLKQRFPAAKVVAIEPDADIAGILRTNVANFGLNDVTIVEAAVSSAEGETYFVADGATGGRLGEEGQGRRVRTIALADLIDRPVSFLKLDVEGAELDVLRACREPLRSVRNLFVEYHSFADRPQELQELLGLLTDAGFRYYIQTEYCPANPLRELPLNAGMDLQLNIFCTRP